MREADARSASPLRVLVVDDDEEMRSLLRRSLEFDGHHVTERDRGTQVLKTLREEAFDLVILDNRMPGLNGLDLLPILRREFPHVPVLLVTAFGGRQVASSALRLGATSYLEKPFRLGQLRDAIAGLDPRAAGPVLGKLTGAGACAESVAVGTPARDSRSPRRLLDALPSTLGEGLDPETRARLRHGAGDAPAGRDRVPDRRGSRPRRRTPASCGTRRTWTSSFARRDCERALAALDAAGFVGRADVSALAREGLHGRSVHRSHLQLGQRRRRGRRCSGSPTPCPAACSGCRSFSARAEEMIWSKAFIMERERYDGADIAHLILACGGGVWTGAACWGASGGGGACS